MGTADTLFHETRAVDDDGAEYGLTHHDLVQAVQVWYCANGQIGGALAKLTVGDAAKAFNVSPDFLAAVIDEAEHPFFFAHGAPDPAARLLDADGL